MKKLIVVAALGLFGLFTVNAQNNASSAQTKKETTAVAKSDSKSTVAETKHDGCKHDGTDACCKAKAKAGKTCSASEMKSCCKHKGEAEASKEPVKAEDASKKN